MGTATIPAKGGDQERGEVRPDEGPAATAGRGQPGGTAASWARSTTTASA